MCEMIFILPSKWAADYDEHVTGNRIQDSHPPIHPSTHHLGGDLSIVQGAGQQEMLRPANVNG